MTEIAEKVVAVSDGDPLAKDWETVRMARARAKEWTQLADLAMGQLKERVGDADQVTINGRPAVRRSERTVTRVDAKALRADLPEEVLAPYLRTSVETRYDLLED